MAREVFVTVFAYILLLFLIIFSLVCSVCAASDSSQNSMSLAKFVGVPEINRENSEQTYDVDNENEFSEIDFKNCGRVDRCVRNESNPWDKFFQLDPFYCRCDDEKTCLEYGDCCYTVVNKIIKNNPWKCKNLQSKTWALMISTCSPDSNNERLKQLCIMESLFDSDYTYDLDLPVYSKSGKFYRNINCALCNGASVDDITRWDVRILCTMNLTQTQIEEFVKESIYKTGKRYYEYFNIFCGLYIPELDALEINKTNPQTRFCGAGVVDSCSNGMNDRTSQLCSSYMQPVNSRSKLVFKNVHCAMCNGINNLPADVQCFRDSTAPARKELDVIMGPRGLPFIYDYTCEMRKLLQRNDAVVGTFMVADCSNRNNTVTVNNTVKMNNTIIIILESVGCARVPLLPISLLIYTSLLIAFSNTIHICS